ncbi:uncharacterized protein LOC141849666 [Brevipalpus obovatus]|uniref:uncharacterized protein LOC141849666 n=1 Tax=Brevipalpus obovatus TaxID=246614 RepID=UPI003D9EC56F
MINGMHSGFINGVVFNHNNGKKRPSSTGVHYNGYSSTATNNNNNNGTTQLSKGRIPRILSALIRSAKLNSISTSSLTISSFATTNNQKSSHHSSSPCYPYNIDISSEINNNTSSHTSHNNPNNPNYRDDLLRKSINRSFIVVFERFIQSVDTMESTVLVPTLLKDIPIDNGGGGNDGSSSHWLPSIIAKGNCRQLFDIYCLMKRCRNDFTEVGFEDDQTFERGQFCLFQMKENETEGDYRSAAAIIVDHLAGLDDEEDLSTLMDDTVVGGVDITTAAGGGVGCGGGSIGMGGNGSGGGGGGGGGGGDIVVNMNIDSSVSSSSSLNSRKQKISLDSGNWSIASDSCTLDDDVLYDCDSTTSSGGSPSSTVNDIASSMDSLSLIPQLIRTTSANLRNLKILFIHLKEVADFITLRYLDALHLS